MRKTIDGGIRPDKRAPPAPKRIVVPAQLSPALHTFIVLVDGRPAVLRPFRFSFASFTTPSLLRVSFTAAAICREENHAEHNQRSEVGLQRRAAQAEKEHSEDPSSSEWYF